MGKLNLIVVAHPDDEILGFGATGKKLVDKGEVVQPVIISSGVEQRKSRPSDKVLLDDIKRANDIVGFNEPVLGDFPNIKLNNVDHIQLVNFIENQIEVYDPSRIFTHHPSDLNNDHLQVSRACVASSRLFQRKEGLSNLESVHYMEVLSSTDWSFSDGNVFQPNLFVEISEQIESKINALKEYKDVMREFPHPRSEEIIRGLASYRGGQSKQFYAEAFQTIFKREI